MRASWSRRAQRRSSGGGSPPLGAGSPHAASQPRAGPPAAPLRRTRRTLRASSRSRAHRAENRRPLAGGPEVAEHDLCLLVSGLGDLGLGLVGQLVELGAERLGRELDVLV